MLKRGLTPLKIAVLILSFGGVVIMLTGRLETSVLVVYDPDPDMGKDEQDDTLDFNDVQEITVSLAIPILLMLCVPILNAIITILFAKMKGLSEFTVCSYQDFGLILLLGPGLYAFSPFKFTFFTWFSWLDYLYITFAGISSALVQVCRMKSV